MQEADTPFVLWQPLFASMRFVLDQGARFNAPLKASPFVCEKAVSFQEQVPKCSQDDQVLLWSGPRRLQFVLEAFCQEREATCRRRASRSSGIEGVSSTPSKHDCRMLLLSAVLAFAPYHHTL